MPPPKQQQQQEQHHHRPRRPLTARKLDIVYLAFFVIHIPVMLLVDLAPLQPAFLRPQISYTLRQFYRDHYRDRYFEAPPAWFTAYMYLEASYHLPLSLWMVWNIPKDHILVPLHLLVFAVETALTTLTCVVDVRAWEGYTAPQRNDLYALYVPYLVVACFMGSDAFLRVKRQIMSANSNSNSNSNSTTETTNTTTVAVDKGKRA
ncbi:hypothetical protein A1O3_07359 [Capronia epimyces CBS 606.96]|uniref:EXPERA domain-containing protein n=1 Tax=Capronia epimyces CBS 606.96 TaxID=1182542 RepID=W9XVP2_9EURO|nr:uncharacterized protein A1O3_07359 [Capronia epimyces CBS 606.96]EXJ81071.1 hypothetical protein A1O3_07359 [Capronia epimyces CBS 606.96]